MSDPLVTGVGGVLSADIAVPEHAREVRFYSRVLTTGENPLWREDLMNNLGMPVIGLGARSAGVCSPPAPMDAAHSGCRCRGQRWACIGSGRESADARQGRRWEEPVGGAARSEWGSVRHHPNRFCGGGPSKLTVPSRATLRRGWDVSPGSI